MSHDALFSQITKCKLKKNAHTPRDSTLTANIMHAGCKLTTVKNGMK